MKIPDSVENWIIDDMTPKQVRYVQPVLLGKATGRVAEIYGQIRHDFQLVLPLTMFSPVPGLLGAVWSLWRETQFAVGSVPRPVTEAVAATVSRLNACPYCVDAHSGMLHASADHDVVDAIMSDNSELIRDARMKRIVEWAAATRSPNAEILRSPPFTQEEAPEIIGTAMTYHFVNRMVSIFLSASPLPVPAGRQGLRRVATRVFGATVGKNIVARKPEPGASLRYLPEVGNVEKFSWASTNSNVAAALAGCEALIEAEGRNALPDAIRASINKVLQQWQGEWQGLGRQWLEEAIEGVSDAHKPAARLALLTTLAPHQIDDKIIQSFRDSQPSDRDLLGTTAWASFAAAQRIGSWLVTH